MTNIKSSLSRGVLRKDSELVADLANLFSMIALVRIDWNGVVAPLHTLKMIGEHIHSSRVRVLDVRSRS